MFSSEIIYLCGCICAGVYVEYWCIFSKISVECGDDGVGGSMEEVFDSVGGGEVRYVEPAPKAKLGEVGFDTKFPLIVICVEQSSKVSSLVDPRQMR
jgi:hypothetical protein